MALAVERHDREFSFSRDATSLSLEELIGEARDAFAGELAIPMTVDQPPNLYDLNAHGERKYLGAEGAQIGLSMSPELYRRIGNPRDDYGNVFPVARALDDLRGWCRGRHLDGRGGPWTDHQADVALLPDLQRPLCARLAHFGIVWHMTPSWAARQEGLQLPVVRRLLTAALRHMWDQRREWAYGDDSGVSEVLAAQRRERREARERAEAASAVGVACRYCARPFDPASLDPCPGGTGDEAQPADTALYAQAGFTLLCSPAASA